MASPSPSARSHCISLVTVSLWPLWSHGRRTIRVAGLNVGTYGLVGRSAKSLAAFALHVLPNGASQKLDSDFTVYGTTMNGETFEEVLRAHTVPGSSAVYPDFRTDPVGEARRFSPSSQVLLRSNGTLVGRVSRPSGFSGYDLTGNVVHIVRNGIVVGHEPTNAKGEFQVQSLNAGVYDFIVAGKDESPQVALRRSRARVSHCVAPTVRRSLALKDHRLIHSTLN